MTRHLPLAAHAVIRAAIEDAHRDGVHDPLVLAQAAATALTDAGWTLTLATPAHAPQRTA